VTVELADVAGEPHHADRGFHVDRPDAAFVLRQENVESRLDLGPGHERPHVAACFAEPDVFGVDVHLLAAFVRLVDDLWRAIAPSEPGADARMAGDGDRRRAVEPGDLDPSSVHGADEGTAVALPRRPRSEPAPPRVEVGDLASPGREPQREPDHDHGGRDQYVRVVSSQRVFIADLLPP
jgi:hypothetical protein